MLETTPQIESLLDKLVIFVLKYRENKAFKNYTEEQIRTRLHAAILNMSMIYCCDRDNSICAIVHGRKDTYSKKFYVYDILSKPNRPNVLKIFLSAFREMFPNYSLIADRHDKRVEYKTDRLIQKVLGKEFYRNN